jgi:hypothetical protein
MTPPLLKLDYNSAGTSALKVTLNFSLASSCMLITWKTGGFYKVNVIHNGNAYFFNTNSTSRTGKRDLGGLLNDGVNSLAR